MSLQRWKARAANLPSYFSTPGALRARMKGCWLNTYQTAIRLKEMGVNAASIIDIGASNGMFSRCMLYVYPLATIYAFDPLADSFEHLNGLGKQSPQVHCERVAIGARNGEDVINRSDYSYSSSLLRMEELHIDAFPHTARSRQETVLVRRLDNVLDAGRLSPPVFLKIDVQGYEDRVLAGGKRVLERTSYLLCELSLQSLYESQLLFDPLYRMITGLGFRYEGQLGELKDPRTKQVLQVDAFFRREK